MTVAAGPLVSYAQNAEDVVLWRAFKDQRTGFYVDVGAASPVQHSVTKLFYDRGWRGINVEPIRQLYEQLASQRPRDVNLQLIAGCAEGSETLLVFPTLPGLSTIDADVALAHRGSGLPMTRVAVRMSRLETILAEHCTERIDFLKIDVEGTEADVLASVDLAARKPRVLVVEATRPRTTIPSHQAWEPMVLGAGYDMVLFDELNRFYVHRGEPASLARALSRPAGRTDNYVTVPISRRTSRPLP
jgi:FkbM family methyltransferase